MKAVNRVIGVDPGESGNICVLSSTGNCDFYKPEEWRVFIRSTWHVLINPGQPMPVYIEKVHSSPRQGVRQAFTFGRSFGYLIGVFEALGYRVQTVAPKDWQRTYKMPSGMEYGERKTWLWDKAKELSGREVFKYQADAYLIARWALENRKKTPGG